MKHRPFHNQHGVTLVELIVVMIVISVALVGVMSVINYTTLHSADPVLRHQSIAIAEAYMEEITLKSFCDPDQTSVQCAANPCSAAEGSRDLYDNVCDYNDLPDTVVRKTDGGEIGELDKYSVSVSVVTEDFGPAVDVVAGLKINVTVTDHANESITLTGYRANY